MIDSIDYEKRFVGQSIPVLTPAEMRKTEEEAFAHGIPSLLLMEHAAIKVVDVLEAELGGSCREKKVLFFCGTGNNGGDGLAAARLFKRRGGYPHVVMAGNAKTPDAKTNQNWAEEIGIPIYNLAEYSQQEKHAFLEDGHDRFDAFVDALLGTGFKGKPEGLMEELIRAPLDYFFPHDHPIIAVDIPSGMDGKSGEIPGACMSADVTVTFHAVKPGLILTKKRDYVGKIVLADIGLWDIEAYSDYDGGVDLEALREGVCYMLPHSAVDFPERPINAHKGDCGRILIYAGSMGMAGAALATAASPIVGMGINALHFRKKTNTLRFRWHKPTFKLLAHVSAVGVSGFIGEIAGGMTTMVLNFLILGLSGSIGVAAYGVVANVAIVATAIFSGISQGSQPLLSDAYSRGETGQVRQVLMMSILTALTLSVLMIVCFEVFAEPLVAVFNSEHDPVMADLACQGMRLYFLGYLFAGFNIAGTGYLSAVGAAKWAMITSILRGVAAIVLCALVMAALFGMTGVWLAFCAAEAITAGVMAVAMKKTAIV